MSELHVNQAAPIVASQVREGISLDEARRLLQERSGGLYVEREEMKGLIEEQNRKRMSPDAHDYIHRRKRGGESPPEEDL